MQSATALAKGRDTMSREEQPENKAKKKRLSPKKVLHLLFSRSFEHNVGKNAAALAYYLMFALFPLLIFVSNLLGLLELNISAIIKTLEHVFPSAVLGIVENYLDYISENSSQTLMWFSLIFSIWFPMRAAKGLMSDVRLAYGLKKPEHPIKYTIRQLIYTVVFLVVIVVTLFVTVMGENVLRYIKDTLLAGVFQMPDSLIGVWQYLRFLPAAVLMFAAIGALYALSVEPRQPIKNLLPGIFSAMLSWLVISIGFSFYVENFANYTLIYGALGAVIVLLMWLYMTAVILILGAELNAVLFTLRADREKEEDQTAESENFES